MEDVARLEGKFGWLLASLLLLLSSLKSLCFRVGQVSAHVETVTELSGLHLGESEDKRSRH